MNQLLTEGGGFTSHPEGHGFVEGIFFAWAKLTDDLGFEVAIDVGASFFLGES